MGIPTSEIKIWGDTLVAMERAATTYLTTYAFNKAAGNSTSSFDMAALAGVMLSAGVMESVLTRYGFTETRSNLDAWNANELPVFMKDTVAVLGGGFADAAFAAAFSGEPMNPEVVFAMSMGRLVGRQIGYGVEVMYPAKTSTAAVNTFGVQGSTYYTQTAEELIAHQSGTHRIQAPNLVPPTTTSSLGYARSVPDSVEDTLPSTQTPRAKALMTPAYHNAIQEEVFAAGNPTYQASRARTGASHRQVGMRSAIESYDAQVRARNGELPVYDHPTKPGWMKLLDEVERRSGIHSPEDLLPTTRYSSLPSSPIAGTLINELNVIINYLKPINVSLATTEGAMGARKQYLDTVINSLESYRTSLVNGLATGQADSRFFSQMRSQALRSLENVVGIEELYHNPNFRNFTQPISALGYYQPSGTGIWLSPDEIARQPFTSAARAAGQIDDLTSPYLQSLTKLTPWMNKVTVIGYGLSVAEANYHYSVGNIYEGDKTLSVAGASFAAGAIAANATRGMGWKTQVTAGVVVGVGTALWGDDFYEILNPPNETLLPSSIAPLPIFPSEFESYSLGLR